MIERADISGVLTQIRSAQGQIHQGMNASKADFSPLVSGLQENSTQSIAGVGAASNVKEVPSFATLLKQAVDNVNGHQQ